MGPWKPKVLTQTPNKAGNVYLEAKVEGFGGTNIPYRKQH